jgi:hypothetical protein
LPAQPKAKGVYRALEPAVNLLERLRITALRTPDQAVGNINGEMGCVAHCL